MSNPLTVEAVKMYDWNDRKIDMSNYQEPNLTQTAPVQADVEDTPVIENPLVETPAAPAEPQVQAAPVVDPEVVNPQARVRILERDNEIMANRLGMAISLLQQQAAGQQAPQPTNDIPAEDQTPIDVIVNELKAIKSKVDELDTKQTRTKQQDVVANALQTANSKIQERLASDQDYFQAFNHLATVIKENIDDDFPDKTEAEKMAIAFTSINEKKLEWIAQGKEPADQMYKYAKRMGFKSSPASTPAQPQEPAPDPRETIQREKQRDNGTGTVATVPASSSNRPNRNFAKMTDEEFHRTLTQGMKENKFDTVTIGRRTPSMHELLPGKALQR